MVAYDKVDKTSESTVPISIDDTAPTIRVLSPTNMQKTQSTTIPARVNISAEVTDTGYIASGVDKVEFWSSGRKVAERTRPHEGSTYIAEITDLKEGANDLMVKGYDKVRNESIVHIILYVERVMGIKKPPLVPETPIKPGIPPPTLPKTPSLPKSR